MLFTISRLAFLQSRDTQTLSNWTKYIIIAYNTNHFSSISTNGATYKPIILDITEKAASIGLHVVNVNTDMGSPNQALWKAFGGDHKETSAPHPARPDRRLHFMPDVAHLVKNLKSALVCGQLTGMASSTSPVITPLISRDVENKETESGCNSNSTVELPCLPKYSLVSGVYISLCTRNWWIKVFLGNFNLGVVSRTEIKPSPIIKCPF